MMPSLLLPLLLSLLLAPAALSKHMSGTISLDSDNTEAFLTKFSFAAGISGKLEGGFTCVAPRSARAERGATESERQRRADERRRCTDGGDRRSRRQDRR